MNGEYNDTQRKYDDMEVVLDENVSSAEETQKLGIMTGDIVCFDPRTVITESGYIKSRFLDDKLSVGILLGFAKYLKEEHITTKQRIYHHVTVYEEVGHGGAASMPNILIIWAKCSAYTMSLQHRRISLPLTLMSRNFSCCGNLLSISSNSPESSFSENGLTR